SIKRKCCRGCRIMSHCGPKRRFRLRCSSKSRYCLSKPEEIQRSGTRTFECRVYESERGHASFLPWHSVPRAKRPRRRAEGLRDCERIERWKELAGRPQIPRLDLHEKRHGKGSDPRVRNLLKTCSKGPGRR